MKTIEEAIQQTKPFKNLRRAAVLNIILSGNELVDAMSDLFQEFGLTHKQYNVMRIIRGAKREVSTSYIKPRMLVKNADTSRIVGRLVSKGFLSKCASETDKRLVKVGLTDEGKKLLKLIDQSISKTDDLLENLSLKECETLNHLLNKIRN